MSSKETLRQRLLAILIKDEAAFNALRQRLADGMSRAWAFGVEAAFRDSLEALRAIDPDRFTARDEARILAAIEARIGGDAMRRAMEGPVVSATDSIWRVGADEAARPAGVDYAFGVKDERALALLNRFDLHWIGRHWDAGTRQTVTAEVREFFERGWSYETLADRLRQAFDGIEARGMAYWQLTADTIATKTREIARIGGYEQAGVRYVEVRAHLDQRTTPICRSLHGRLIPLGHIQTQRDRYLDAISRGNMERAKTAWPMMDAAHEVGGGRVLPGNIGLPPYHFRCRTVTVAYLGRDPDALTDAPEDDIERMRLAVRSREPASRADVARAVDRALMARWDAGRLGDHVKHAVRGIEDYNRAAFELIRGRQIKREIALAMRDGHVCGVFFAPYKDRYRVAVVNLERLTLITQHIRDRIEARVYEVQPIVQPKSERIVKGGIWPW